MLNAVMRFEPRGIRIRLRSRRDESEPPDPSLRLAMAAVPVSIPIQPQDRPFTSLVNQLGQPRGRSRFAYTLATG